MKNSSTENTSPRPRPDDGSASVRLYVASAALLICAVGAWIGLAQGPVAAAPSAPEAHWAWGSDASQATADASGNGHAAELRSPSHASPSADAASGLATLVFDGAADGADPALHGHVVCTSLPPPAAGFAVAALVSPAGAQAAYAPAVSRVADPASWDGGFALYIGPSGTLCAFVGDFADPASRLDSGIVPPQGAWTHAALSYDGAEAVLYVDGEETARAAAPDAELPAAPLAIGSLVAMGVTRPFNGAVADVRLYASPLSASETASVSAGSLSAYAAPPPDGDAEPEPAAAKAAAVRQLPDSDGDGVPDEEEIRLGRDPFSPGATSPRAPMLNVHTPME